MADPTAQPVAYPGDAPPPTIPPGGSQMPQFEPPVADQASYTGGPIQAAGGQPGAKQPSTLKKILMGVFDTIATSQGFKNHYDYQNDELRQQRAQQQIDIAKQNANTQQSAQDEATKWRQMQEAQATPQPIPQGHPFTQYGIPAGTMMTPAQQQGVWGKIIESKVKGETQIDVAEAKINTKGTPTVGDVDATVAGIFQQAGLNPAKLTPAQRVGLQLAKNESLQKNNTKPITDWASKIMSAEASRSNTVIRMEGYQQARQYQVLDTKYGNAPKFVSAEELNRAHDEEPGRYLSQTGGASALKQENVLNDIRGSMKQIKEALNPMGEFRPAFRAQLSLVMRSHNPASAMSALVNSSAFGSMAPDEQNLSIALNQGYEQVMGLRAVLGMGQGSDMMRDAIKATLPGSTTPNKSVAYRQIDAVNQVIDRLEKGVPEVPLRGEGATGARATHRYNPATGKIEAIQ